MVLRRDGGRGSCAHSQTAEIGLSLGQLILDHLITWIPVGRLFANRLALLLADGAFRLFDLLFDVLHQGIGGGKLAQQVGPLELQIEQGGLQLIVELGAVRSFHECYHSWLHRLQLALEYSHALLCLQQIAPSLLRGGIELIGLPQCRIPFQVS